jgi:hypothetical protein
MAVAGEVAVAEGAEAVQAASRAAMHNRLHKFKSLDLLE